MDNFPPHLSCVSTLPETTLVLYILNRQVVFLWAGGSEKNDGWCDQVTTDDYKCQYSLKFQILTGVSVAHLPDWTLRSVTNITFSTVGLHAVQGQLNRCLSFFSTSVVPTLTWKFFQQLLCSLFFKQIQIYNQNTIIFIKRHFPYPEKL